MLLHGFSLPFPLGEARAPFRPGRNQDSPTSPGLAAAVSSPAPPVLRDQAWWKERVAHSPSQTSCFRFSRRARSWRVRLYTTAADIYTHPYFGGNVVSMLCAYLFGSGHLL